MAQLLGSSSGLVQHGCLVVCRADSPSDVSDWDPSEAAFYTAGDAIIFAVRPSVVGPVEVEAWQGMPGTPLEHVLFSESLSEGSKHLLLSDPNDVVSVEFDSSQEEVIVQARVDNVEWPARVQVIVSPGT